MNLATMLPAEAVLPLLPARDKKQALRLMAVQAAALSAVPEREIFSVLMEREYIGCTGVGNGVCIPHGRFEGLTAPLAIFAHVEQPIEFGAADGKLVDLIFLLMTPAEANTEHLKALAVVSRLLRDKQLCENLRKTSDPAVIHGLLLAADRDEDAA